MPGQRHRKVQGASTLDLERNFGCQVRGILCSTSQVGWLKARDQTILALHKRVITHNARIDVDHEEDRSVSRSELLTAAAGDGDG